MLSGQARCDISCRRTFDRGSRVPYENPEALRRLIGGRIRQARQAQNLSQPDVAKILGVTATTISEWELGKTNVTAAQLAALARFLDKPPGYFFDELNIGKYRSLLYRD